MKYLNPANTGKTVTITLGERVYSGYVYALTRSMERSFRHLVICASRVDARRPQMRYFHLYFHDNGSVGGKVSSAPTCARYQSTNFTGTWLTKWFKARRLDACYMAKENVTITLS